jgi:hypothetical protein
MSKSQSVPRRTSEDSRAKAWIKNTLLVWGKLWGLWLENDINWHQSRCGSNDAKGLAVIEQKLKIAVGIKIMRYDLGAEGPGVESLRPDHSYMWPQLTGEMGLRDIQLRTQQ